MSHIPGITFKRNTKGEATQVTIDLRKYGEELEDFLDSLIVEARKEESTISANDILKKTDKFHGIKSVKRK